MSVNKVKSLWLTKKANPISQDNSSKKRFLKNLLFSLPCWARAFSWISDALKVFFLFVTMVESQNEQLKTRKQRLLQPFKDSFILKALTFLGVNFEKKFEIWIFVFHNKTYFKILLEFRTLLLKLIEQKLIRDILP